jgi:hypothetical protein
MDRDTTLVVEGLGSSAEIIKMTARFIRNPNTPGLRFEAPLSAAEHCRRVSS